MKKLPSLGEQKHCEKCDGMFFALFRETKRGKARFCSVSCGNAAKADSRRNPNWYKEWCDRVKSTPEHKIKRSANHKIAHEIKMGRMFRQPCEMCGKVPAEAHHDDYSKPLDVRWLRRSHHMKHDRNRGKLTAS